MMWTYRDSLDYTRIDYQVLALHVFIGLSLTDPVLIITDDYNKSCFYLNGFYLLAAMNWAAMNCRRL